MKFLLIAFVLCTAACKKESKSEGGGAAAAANPCEAAVDRGVDQTINKRRGPDAPAMTPQEAEVPKKLKVALAKSCADDKWSTEIIDCFKTADDIATCKEKLTPEQRAGYSRAAMSVMAGAGAGQGSGHGGMAPPMPPSTPPPPPSGSADGSGSAAN